MVQRIEAKYVCNRHGNRYNKMEKLKTKKSGSKTDYAIQNTQSRSSNQSGEQTNTANVSNKEHATTLVPSNFYRTVAIGSSPFSQEQSIDGISYQQILSRQNPSMTLNKIK